MSWRANRCAGEWFSYILKSVGTMHDVSQLGNFITVDMTGEAPAVEELREQWLIDEKQKLKTLFTLVVECASSRAWSQMMFTNLLPNSFAAVKHEHAPTAERLLQNIHRVWESVLLAECIVSGKREATMEVKKGLKDRLNDICWNQLQLSREIYLECARANWNVHDGKVQLLAERLYGCPYNTKYDLEDAFAHLTSVGKMTSLATGMNKSLESNSFVHPSIQSFTHAFIHSVSHSSIHPFIHPSVHPSIQTFIHPSIHSLTHSTPLHSTHSFIHSFLSFIHSINHSLTHFFPSFIFSFIHFFHSFIHLSIHSSNHPLIQSSTHPSIYPHPSIHSFVRSFIPSFTHPFIDSSTHPSIHSFVRSFLPSFIRSCMFTQSFFHSLFHPYFTLLVPVHSIIFRSFNPIIFFITD